MQSAEHGTESLIMSQINLCEVHYKSIRVIGLDKARKFLETFFLLPIIIIHPSDELIWKAAEIKAEHPISLADCFAIATALENKATIITGDPEFKLVKKLVDVEWI